MALIEACRASFKYGENRVFEDISFAVHPGEIFCLLGPNGCGKTTLLDCLIGSRKPNSGDILLNGKNINNLRAEDIAKGVAYVPQNHQKSFPYTVEEIVMMGRAPYIGLFAAPQSTDYEIVHGILEDFGLVDLQHRPYTQISGGQMQLVMIARALAQQTPLLIMDEPTSHLDFKHEISLLDMTVRIVRELGIAVIMASHFPNHAFYFENKGVPTRVALMSDHTFRFCGQPSEELTPDTLREVYQVVTQLVSYPGPQGSVLKHIVPVCTYQGKEGA
jgi:iron complex transport system ATP-binding protein